MPWGELEALVGLHYPKGENGRPPVGLSIMLRVYFLQQWFNLSDPGAEDALYRIAGAAALCGNRSRGARRCREHKSWGSVTCWRNTNWAGRCSTR